MNLVIVESPAKAKTINKYLGSEYQVIASCGHVRDLAAKNGSVEPDNDFAMTWEVNEKSRKHLKSIVTAAKKAERLILATDPDREGEAISWHVLEILQQEYGLKNIKVERVVFNAVTKSAILQAMKQPRQIDIALVEAYLARRALDYLVGFTLSPVLWRKLPAARSAGRVQSVTLRILCEREQEIESFITEEYCLCSLILSPAPTSVSRHVLSLLTVKNLIGFQSKLKSRQRPYINQLRKATLRSAILGSNHKNVTLIHPSQPPRCNKMPHAGSASRRHGSCKRLSASMKELKSVTKRRD